MTTIATNNDGTVNEEMTEKVNVKLKKDERKMKISVYSVFLLFVTMFIIGVVGGYGYKYYNNDAHKAWYEKTPVVKSIYAKINPAPWYKRLLTVGD